jgi:hypothetical protein
VVDDLGQLEGSYGSMRRLPAGVALATMGGAAFVGLMLALTHRYAYALTLPLAVLAVLAIVRYRVEPPEHRRWLMVYERGLVERAPHPGPGGPVMRVVPFGDVTGVVPDPAFPGRPALALASEPSSTLRLGDLSPVHELHSHLDRHLPGVVPRPRAARGLLVGAALAVLMLVPAVVPVARALTPGPAADTADTAGTAEPSSTYSYSPPQLGSAPTPPPSGPHAIDMPTDVAGFWKVCDGNFVPSAPAYEGPPPHPLWDRSPTYSDDAWRTTTPTAVQLVACHDVTRGATIRTCRYTINDEPFTQTLHKASWTTVIREAKTARVIATSSFAAADERCKPVPELIHGGNGYLDYGPHQYAEPTDRQAYDNLGRYVLG